MTNVNRNKCLLIGSPAGILSEGRLHCTTRKTFPEGLSLLKDEHFDVIYVVYAEIDEPKLDMIRSIGVLDPGSKLIILSQMYEEAEVIQTIRRSGIREVDYVICPITPEDFNGTPSVRSPFDLPADAKDRKIRELETLVLQDDLTGLKNRRYLRLFLPAILDEAQIHGFQVTLLLFDIDDFKHYNDAYGHSTGDRVLRQTATLIRRCCRTQDIVVRLGGDEFAVIFWDRSCTRPTEETLTIEETERRACRDHPREALFMAERFRREMSTASFDVLGVKGKGSLTISGGLASYPTDASMAEVLFEKADQAMLEAKRSGKNRLYLVGRPDLNA